MAGAFSIDKIALDNLVDIVPLSIDPSVTGYAAPIGSLALRDTGELWLKVGAADTDWKLIGFSEDITNVSEVFTVLSEPTGHPNRTDTTIEFDDGTRTFTITPVGASFDYWIHGVKYTITTPKSIQIPDSQGMHYIYFDTNENLVVESGSPTIPDLLLNHAYTCALYWDVTTQTSIYAADERHGVVLDGMTHIHFHLSLGTQYITGLALNSLIVDGTGDLPGEAQFGVENGVIRDEDLQHNIVNGVADLTQTTVDLEQILTAPAEIPIMYRIGATGDWRIKTADTYPLIYSGDSTGYVGGANGLPPWNEWTGATWQLTEMVSGRYFMMHYVATNDWRHPIIGIQGIEQYQNKPQGLADARNELNQLTGLPFTEWVPIASIIFTSQSGDTNVPKATAISTGDGDDYVDWRTLETYAGTIGGAGVSDHGNLSGLLDDDHTQYHTEARADTWLYAKQVTVVGNPTPAQDQLIFALPDTARAKTLSVETQAYHFSETTISPLEWIQIGVSADALSAIRIPLNATIVRAGAHCADTGGNAKDIDLYVNGVNTATLGSFTGGTAEETWGDNTLNIDVNAGDLIRLRGGAQGGNIQDTVISLYIKWRA